MEKIKRVGITTGGGDAPGLNAVIKAVVFSARNRGWEVFGIKDGYNGFFEDEFADEPGVLRLRKRDVWNITPLGGTILGTTNKGNPFSYPVKNDAGEVELVDRSDEIVSGMQKYGIDALIAVGGDGSLSIADKLFKKGVRIVGVPKTIDNDLDKTVMTFGFDTAVSFATECIDRLHSTAQAHQRIIIVEMMGRYAGWIALNSGISGGADVILIPEIHYDINAIVHKINEIKKTGRKYAIIAAAEGAKEKGGKTTYLPVYDGEEKRLGGIGDVLRRSLMLRMDKNIRVVVLGHLLRGGSPTTFDRLLSLRFGAAAVRALDEGKSGIMVALNSPTVDYVPLELATKRMKRVPIDCDSVLTALDLGISFGDSTTF